MEGRGQFPPDEIERGRSIASLRIHVEQAIGRMKQYQILTGIFPLKMSRIANQVVTVCAYLSNFHLALVPMAILPHSPASDESISIDNVSNTEMEENSETGDSDVCSLV